MIEHKIKLCYEAGIERGYWDGKLREDYEYRTEFLMQAITEAGEAVNALRDGRYANIPKFVNHLNEGGGFKVAFEEHIKDTFEDEMTDIFIYLCNFAWFYGLNMSQVENEFTAEYEAQAGIKIQNIKAYLFDIVRSITDIKFAPFPEQYTGEALAKITYLMKYWNHDLDWFVNKKLEYNRHRHGL